MLSVFLAMCSLVSFGSVDADVGAGPIFLLLWDTYRYALSSQGYIQILMCRTIHRCMQYVWVFEYFESVRCRLRLYSKYVYVPYTAFVRVYVP